MVEQFFVFTCLLVISHSIFAEIDHEQIAIKSTTAIPKKGCSTSLDCPHGLWCKNTRHMGVQCVKVERECRIFEDNEIWTDCLMPCENNCKKNVETVSYSDITTNADTKKLRFHLKWSWRNGTEDASRLYTYDAELIPSSPAFDLFARIVSGDNKLGKASAAVNVFNKNLENKYNAMALPLYGLKLSEKEAQMFASNMVKVHGDTINLYAKPCGQYPTDPAEKDLCSTTTDGHKLYLNLYSNDQTYPEGIAVGKMVKNTIAGTNFVDLTKFNNGLPGEIRLEDGEMLITDIESMFKLFAASLFFVLIAKFCDAADSKKTVSLENLKADADAKILKFSLEWRGNGTSDPKSYEITVQLDKESHAFDIFSKIISGENKYGKDGAAIKVFDKPFENQHDAMTMPFPGVQLSDEEKKMFDNEMKRVSGSSVNIYAEPCGHYKAELGDIGTCEKPEDGYKLHVNFYFWGYKPLGIVVGETLSSTVDDGDFATDEKDNTLKLSDGRMTISGIEFVEPSII